jgi:molybdate transport system substrate-binding protein
MRKLKGCGLILLIAILGCSNPSRNRAASGTDELTLFVAASLTDVITALADSVEKEQNIHLKLNLASSGTLARQLKEGMPCDIYFSASKRWMDYVAENGLIDSTSCCTPIKNSLVLISPKGKLLTDSLGALPSVLDTRLSIGDPAHVPAGKYAVEALKSMKIYEPLSNRFLPAKDVRSALMVVELGEADFGIVYKTDAMKSDKVDISAVFPDSTHTPIVYHVALMKSSEKKKRAQEVLNFLTGEKSKTVWRKYGFQPAL